MGSSRNDEKRKGERGGRADFRVGGPRLLSSHFPYLPYRIHRIGGRGAPIKLNPITLGSSERDGATRPPRRKSRRT